MSLTQAEIDAINGRPYDQSLDGVHYGAALKNDYDPALDSNRLGFAKSPTNNDTLVIKSKNSNQLFPIYDFNVPKGKIWSIVHIMDLWYHPWPNQINPNDLLMHIYCQYPDVGLDNIIWSSYAHFVQWREPQVIKLPDDTYALQPGRVVTDTSEGTWARYQTRTDVDIPLFGPCRVYIGIWNGNPVGWPNASAHLTFSVFKGYKGQLYL